MQKRQTTNDHKTTVSFSMSQLVIERVKTLAAHEDRPVSWIAQRLITEALDAREVQRA